MKVVKNDMTHPKCKSFHDEKIMSVTTRLSSCDFILLNTF
jgi:hypothetical protein